MYARFPLSLEQLPRPRGCACFSLRSGCLLTSIISILYSVLMLSVGLAAVSESHLGDVSGLRWTAIVTVLAAHAIALALSALMLVGSLREKAWMIRPWVLFKTLQLATAILMFIVDTALRVADVDFSMMPYILARFLAIVIWSYLVVVASSYLRELEETAAEAVGLKQMNEYWYTAV